MRTRNGVTEISVSEGFNWMYRAYHIMDHWPHHYTPLATLLLGYLVKHASDIAEHIKLQKDGYYDKEDYLEEWEYVKGWVTIPIATIEKDLNISGYERRRAWKELITKGAIECKRMGVPARNYFKANLRNKLVLIDDEDDAEDE